jgi:hypothetical protein
MEFEIVGDITDVETVAAGRGIHDLPRLRRLYGGYEAHGIGKKEFKRKGYLD